VASCVFNGTDESGRLGYGNGLIALPDVDGDAMLDLLMPAWFANKAYVLEASSFFTTHRFRRVTRYRC